MELKRPSQSELEMMSKAELISMINLLFDLLEKYSGQVAGFSGKIDQLEEKVQDLEKKQTPKKNSRNSSQSPATDLSRKHKKSDKKKKLGPPDGHKGTSRKLIENPDLIVDVPLKNCPRTGQKVKTKSKSYKRHQIIELEPVKAIVIELHRQTTTGPDGKTIVAPNPDGINNNQRYGPNLKMHIAYMRYEQNLPWSKIWNYFKDIVGLKIGIGTIQSIFDELQSDLESEYQELKKDIANSQIVGCDETGFHVNSEKWWIHLARTEDTTVFIPNKSRGHQVLQDLLGKDFDGWLCTDFWGGYSSKFYPNAKFQKCVGAHLLRDIEYAIQCEKGKGTYAQQLFNLFFDAIILKKYFIFDTPEYREEVVEKENRLDALLTDGMDTVTMEGEKLRKRLIKYRDHLLNFLYYEKLNPDNNASERDIRDYVMIRKISGAYRSERGIEATSIAKSIISTYKKRKIDFLERFKLAFGDYAYDTS